MSYRKNVASQYLYFGLVYASDGSAMTGATVTARRSIDGAAQTTCTGTVNEKGNGQYELAMSQADINGNDIGFFFTAVGGSPTTAAVPVSICVVTTAADPTDSVRYGLTALPNAAAGANTGLPVVGTQIPNANAGANTGLPVVGTQIPNATAGANTGLPVVGTQIPNATAGANTGLPVVGTQVPNATAGASGGLPLVGSQIPNANAAANGGLPTVDANNRVKIRAAAKKNTALANFEFTMFDSDGNLETGLTVTLTLSKDGAAPVSSDNSVTEVTSGGGRYKVNLTANDLNADVIDFIATATGARALSWTWNMLE